MSEEIKKITVFLFLSFGALFLSFLFYIYAPKDWELDSPLMLLMAQFMLYYLFFIFIRTALLLFLSFIEFINKKTIPPVKSFPLVSIIVPCYNEEVVLENAINSILKIDYPNLEILIVDDGSKDQTFDIAKKCEKKSDQIRVIYQENSGKAHALNNALAQCYGDYFICMDADSVLSENVLLDSIPYFENDTSLAAVAGAVKVGNSHNLLTQFQKLEYIIGLNFHKLAQSCLKMVTIVPGPIGVFNKEAVLKVGAYNSETYAEDCDLTMRLLMHGYHIKYNSEISATTEAPDEIGQLVIQRYRWSRGMIQSIIKSLSYLRSNPSIRSFTVIIYMFLETLFIPIINFVFIILTLQLALNHDSIQLFGPYFIGLTLLDLALCLYSIIFEKNITKLFFLGIINRVTYGLALEVIRFLSIIDEFFQVPMKWGDLKRKGIQS